MKYKCSKCGQEHEGWPAIAFDTPDPYHDLSETDKADIAEIGDDFCVIKHVDQTDRFIRVVLKQKVNNNCQSLEYGVWVSLSEKSFKDYSDHFTSGDNEATYFGYLFNKIPGYTNTHLIKMNVVVSNGSTRPEIFPHDDQMEIDFVRDFYKGIDKETAESRIESAFKI